MNPSIAQIDGPYNHLEKPFAIELLLPTWTVGRVRWSLKTCIFRSISGCVIERCARKCTEN